MYKSVGYRKFFRMHGEASHFASPCEVFQTHEPGNGEIVGDLDDGGVCVAMLEPYTAASAANPNEANWEVGIRLPAGSPFLRTKAEGTAVDFEGVLISTLLQSITVRCFITVYTISITLSHCLSRLQPPSLPALSLCTPLCFFV